MDSHKATRKSRLKSLYSLQALASQRCRTRRGSSFSKIFLTRVSGTIGVEFKMLNDESGERESSGGRRGGTPPRLRMLVTV